MVYPLTMNRRRFLSVTAAALPPAALRETSPELYWQRIRDEQFMLPDWRNFLNNGSLGLTPRPVLKAMEDFMQGAAGLVSDEYPRWGYETLDAERAEMAGFVGCRKDELAFMHNATEAMSTIAAGIDLKAGDEVLITDQEHVSGQNPWKLKVARYGITLREVKIPIPPKSAGQLAEVVVSAIGPKTRVLSFSGILTTLGTIMPVREICDAARKKGVITVVDGAHMNGQIPFKMSELGCDYFAGSPHKWMFAPAGCGLLYIREENLDRLWPSIVTGDWDRKELKAARFMKLGTNNRATVVGMMTGLKFLRELGPEIVYNRIHELAKYNESLARQRSYIEVLSSADERLYGSLIAIGFKGADLSEMWKRLRSRRIWTMISPTLRISTHIHTRRRDLEEFYGTLDEVFGQRRG